MPPPNSESCLQPGVSIRIHLFKNCDEKVSCMACCELCDIIPFLKCEGCRAPIHVECLRKAQVLRGELQYVCVLCRLQDSQLNSRAKVRDMDSSSCSLDRRYGKTCIACFSTIQANDAVFCKLCSSWFCATSCSVLGLQADSTKSFKCPEGWTCRACTNQETDTRTVDSLQRNYDAGKQHAESERLDFNTAGAAFVQMMHDVSILGMTDVYGMFEPSLKELVKLERLKAETWSYLPCVESSQLISAFSFIKESDAFAIANAHARVYFEQASERVREPRLKRQRTGGSTSADMELQNPRPKAAIVTSDWLHHPTQYMLQPVFKCLEQEYTLVFFLFTPPPPDIQKELIGLVGRSNIFDISGIDSPDNAAQKILDSRPDIILNLDGHTGTKQRHWGAVEWMVHNGGLSVKLFCFLAYPGVYGGTMTYTLVDRIVAPSLEVYGSAKTVYMRSSYHLTAAPKHSLDQLANVALAQRHSRMAHGFAEHDIVLGFVGRLGRLNTETMDSFIRIKERIPALKLLLVAHNSSAFTTHNKCEYLLHVFALGDIIIGQQLKPGDDELRTAVAATVVADTVVGYGLHSMASNALRSCIPVVTNLSNEFHNNVAASILDAVGLRELIANSAEEYENILVKVLTDKEYHQGLRLKLDKAKLCQSAVFNPELGAQDLVQAIASVSLVDQQTAGPASQLEDGEAIQTLGAQAAAEVCIRIAR